MSQQKLDMMPPEDRRMVLTVAPGEEEWGSRNDRWREDLFELRRELDRAVPDALPAESPTDGSKSGFELVPILIAMGSAGVFTAAVGVLRTWLHEKPGRRTVVVEYEFDRDGCPERGKVTLTAHNIASNDLTELAEKALSAGA